MVTRAQNMDYEILADIAMNTIMPLQLGILFASMYPD